jgi:hypothetical protein
VDKLCVRRKAIGGMYNEEVDHIHVTWRARSVRGWRGKGRSGLLRLMSMEKLMVAGKFSEGGRPGEDKTNVTPLRHTASGELVRKGNRKRRHFVCH